MSPKIVDKEKRKQEILVAALEQFVEKGYHKTTLGDVARAAGMGQGTLYYYFPTKDLIFWGVYDYLMSHVEQWMIQQITMFQSAHEQLSFILKMLFQNFPEAGVFENGENDEDEPLPRGAVMGFSQVLMEFWLQAERSDKRDEFYQRVARQQGAMIARLQDLLEKMGTGSIWGLNSEDMAHLLVALRDGLSFQLRMGSLEKRSGLPQRIRQALQRTLQQPQKGATPLSLEPKIQK